MIRTTLLFAAAFIGVGVFFCMDTGRESVTALIPAFIGVALAICSLLGRNPKLSMHVMRVAVLLSVATAGMTLKGALAYLDGNREPAIVAKTITCLLALALFVLQIRSFVQAPRRRSRKLPGGGAAGALRPGGDPRRRRRTRSTSGTGLPSC